MSHNCCTTRTGFGQQDAAHAPAGRREIPQHDQHEHERRLNGPAAEPAVARFSRRRHGACSAAARMPRLGHGLADLVVQQPVELVADRGEFLRGDEVGPARVRLVDRDDLLDGAGPCREHRDPVGEERGLAQAVGHEHDGLVGARQQNREILAEDHAGLLVERAERLIHQQNAGLEAERARQRRTLAHAARQLSRIMLGEILEPDRLQRALRARLALGPRHALEHHAEIDVLEHGVPGEQRVFLEHEGDVARHRPGHLLAGDLHRAGGGLEQSADDVEQASTCRSRSGRSGRAARRARCRARCRAAPARGARRSPRRNGARRS